MKVATVVSAFIIAAFAAAAVAAVPTPTWPAGTIGTRTPTFRWTDTGAAKFTVELVRDEAQRTTYTTTAPKMEYPGKLGVGVYRWRVKEGGGASASPWSAPLSFTCPPDMPSPIAPLNDRIAASSNAPGLYWTNIDPDATRFMIQMYRDGDLLGFMAVEATKKPDATWPAYLPAGSYAWRIKAVRKTGDDTLTLSSPWSEMAPFAIGVPLSCTIIRPVPHTTLPMGSYGINMTWSTGAGATSYTFDLLRNGYPFASYSYVSTNITPTSAWSPGHYSMIITPVNSYGAGAPSSPRTFLIAREMSPGDDQVLDAPTNRLEWSRSADCTSYRVRLFKATPPEGNYQLLKEESVPQPLGQPSWRHKGAITAEPGAYKWQITDFKTNNPLYTSTDYFSILVPGRPTLLKPYENKIAGLLALSFTWKQASGSPSHYQFQLWRNGDLLKDSGFKPVAEFTKVAAYYRTYNLTSAGPGNYRWRVRAKNSEGVGGWAEREHKIAALAQIKIASPATNATYSTGTPITLQWLSVEGAQRYEVQFWQNGTASTFTQPAATGIVQTRAWNVGFGEYAIRIRACADGNGPWSDLRIITGT